MTINDSGQKSIVLIAEDEEISFLYLSSILKKEPIDVLRANNGQEAVDICRANNDIDLVLMDINMPVMDGFEATSQIKTFRKELPVIAVTAYAFQNTEQKAKYFGCNDYLPKPVKKDVLIATIQKYIKPNNHSLKSDTE
ncbi:MAG: response regulator [Bacteroidales bacterium]|nr:response regulator [Bacteroidales bacterium]